MHSDVYISVCTIIRDMDDVMKTQVSNGIRTQEQDTPEQYTIQRNDKSENRYMNSN